MQKPRLLIVGLDGFTWTVADPLIEAGRLPNLARLVSAGARGTLRSFEPLLTPILWTDIASGKLPEKHGVTRFISTSLSLRTKRIWDLLEQPERPIGLWGWPVTWPTRPVNGFVVPSLFARENDTYPESLRFVKEMEEGVNAGFRQRIRLVAEALRHGLRVQTAAQIAVYALGRKQGHRRELNDFAAVRTLKLNIHLDVYEYLVKSYQPYCTCFYMNQPDAFSHFFWHYYEPELFPDVNPSDAREYGSMIPHVYELADGALGRLLALTDERTLVVVVSDHGFQAEIGKGEAWVRNRPRGRRLLEVLKLADADSYVNYRNWILIDVQGDRSAIVDILRQFWVEEMNQPLFDVEEDDLGLITVFVHNQPSYQEVDPSSMHVRWPGGRLAFLELVSTSYNPRQSGTHHPDGVIVFHGPGVQPGARVDGGTIVDVVPTALALLEMPIGRDMDGQVLTDVLSPTLVQRAPVTYIDTYDTDLILEGAEQDEPVSPELMARLRALGYVD